MTKILRRTIEGSVNAVANNPSFIKIPVYGTIKDILIRPVTSTGTTATQANILAELQRVELVANGNAIVSLSMRQIYDLGITLGNNIFQNASAGVFGLNLARLFYDDAVIRSQFGFGSVGLNDLSVKIYSGTLSTIVAFEVMTLRTDEASNFSTYFKALSFNQSIAGAGQLSVTTLPKQINENFMLAQLSTGTGGVVTWNKLRMNNANITDEIHEDFSTATINEFQYNKPSGTSTILMTDGSIYGGIPLDNVTQLELQYNFTTAPSENQLALMYVTLFNPPVAIKNAILGTV